jgi:hypothetical protein
MPHNNTVELILISFIREETEDQKSCKLPRLWQLSHTRPEMTESVGKGED